MSGMLESERLEFAGVAVSPGFAIGPLWTPERNQSATYLPKLNAALEAAALKEAVQLASREIAELSKATKGAAVDILEFQIEVLRDKTFEETALELIWSNKNAHEAWQLVVGAEVSNYQKSHDEIFSARAIDLQDVQNRVARILCNEISQFIPANVIVLAENLSPTAFISHEWSGSGIAQTGGSSVSHLAIMARQFGVPMVINLDQSVVRVESGMKVLINAGPKTGILIASPTSADETAAKQWFHQTKIAPKTSLPILTGNGEAVGLMINLAHLRELNQIDINDYDGIGLVRTEFLFAGQQPENPQENEETQFQAYSEILRWAKGKPVHIRTIDAGGDKDFSGYRNNSVQSKMRGIQLSLSNTDVFRVQIRALLRASVFGQLHVTLPMVANENEFQETIALFQAEAQNLACAKITHAMPGIGIMVELPGVAMTLARYAKATHFAIGTNDLIQYALSEPRDAMGAKSSVDNPAVSALITEVVSIGRALDKFVSVCGNAASEAKSVRVLLDAGVRQLSIYPPARSEIVAAIQAHNLKERL